MQNNDYIDFMNEFGNDWNDIKVIILYQKLYQSIKKQYYNKYNKKIPNKLLIVILVKLFENNKVRKIIMNRFVEYINSEIKDDNIIDLRNNSYNNLLLLN
jgi:vacuolar-type H+-ATPase subunit F/Vma7